MPRIVAICCALIGLGAIALGSLAAFHPARVTPRQLSDWEVGALARLAEKSCRCERSVGQTNKNACWANFNRKMPPPEPPGTDWLTACDPVSTATRCGPNSKGFEDCVTIRYEYFTSDGRTLLLCSKEEARAVENSWLKTSRLLPGGRLDSSVADKVARDLVAGKPIPATSGPRGCASS